MNAYKIKPCNHLQQAAAWMISFFSFIQKMYVLLAKAINFFQAALLYSNDCLHLEWNDPFLNIVS